MELITQFLATVCSTIFGTFFMFYLIALAFDVMSGNKSQSMSRAVVSFSLKIIGLAGKGFVLLSIPLLRNVGEKIWYVASYYADKNKQKPHASFSTPTQAGDPTIVEVPFNSDLSPDPVPAPGNDGATGPVDDPVKTNTGPAKKKSENPYESPADPEFIE